MDIATIWDVIKTILSWAWIPLGAYMTYRTTQTTRDMMWKDEMEARIIEAESNVRLHTLQIQTIKETLKETKDSIKDVKNGVDKLVDKLIK